MVHSINTFVLGISSLGGTPLGKDQNEYYYQMMDYYPDVIQAIREFQYLISTQCLNVKEMHEKLDLILSNAFIETAEEDRIAMWEKYLGIVPPPQGDQENEAWLTSRRDTILARLYQSEKLNTKSIEDIVRIFTGGSAESWMIDHTSVFESNEENILDINTLYVKIHPTDGNKIYNLDRIKTELENKRPAHLKLLVCTSYDTWDEVKSKFPTWGDLSEGVNNWNELAYNAPSEDIFEYIVDEDGNSIMDESNKRLFN